MIEIFKKFTTDYPSDRGSIQLSDPAHVLPRHVEFLDHFYTQIGSGSFSSGLIRFFQPGSMDALSSWKRIAGARDISDLYSRLVPFSSTWHGDLFCFDMASPPDKEPIIRMLEPGTGKLLKIADSFGRFIGHTLVQQREAALVESFYKQWKLAAGKPPLLSQCVGYRLPLFLSGEDMLDNLEIVDQEVYIDICGSLFSETSTLPIGTSIAEIARAR